MGSASVERFVDRPSRRGPHTWRLAVIAAAIVAGGAVVVTLLASLTGGSRVEKAAAAPILEIMVRVDGNLNAYAQPTITVPAGAQVRSRAPVSRKVLA